MFISNSEFFEKWISIYAQLNFKNGKWNGQMPYKHIYAFLNDHISTHAIL
jgi:hypothetical protein